MSWRKGISQLSIDCVVRGLRREASGACRKRPNVWHLTAQQQHKHARVFLSCLHSRHMNAVSTQGHLTFSRRQACATFHTVAYRQIRMVGSRAKCARSAPRERYEPVSAMLHKMPCSTRWIAQPLGVTLVHHRDSMSACASQGACMHSLGSSHILHTRREPMQPRDHSVCYAPQPRRPFFIWSLQSCYNILLPLAVQESAGSMHIIPMLPCHESHGVMCDSRLSAACRYAVMS